jgi:hypothetical protein
MTTAGSDRSTVPVLPILTRRPSPADGLSAAGSWFDLAAGLLPAVTGATVNMASGSQPVIDRIREAWNPDIETMEGAWLAYLCAMAGIPWIAVRAVSNMVEPRNREELGYTLRPAQPGGKKKLLDDRAAFRTGPVKQYLTEKS